MSDNIPFEIQIEIIKKVSDVKSLIQFRSVSKPWKSFIESSQFINGYGSRHTQPHSHILSYKPNHFLDESNYICLVDDDIETFKVQEQELAPFVVVSPLFKQSCVCNAVIACHGLLCLCCFDNCREMVVIWNPSIRKSFGIVSPGIYYMNKLVYGFGVCPVTSDPTVVMVLCAHKMPWHVEVYTLSSGVWNVIPSCNMPRQSIRLNKSSQVVIDRFIYWAAYDETFDDDGVPHYKYMVVSFDLITKEFKVVDLPDTLSNELDEDEELFVSKLRESLVIYGSIYVDGAKCCGIWVMEHDLSFRKLFTIGAPVEKILGFKKNGETIFETIKEDRRLTTLDVYDPCSQQIKNLGISGYRGSFFMVPCKESLLLLHHSDSRIY